MKTSPFSGIKIVFILLTGFDTPNIKFIEINLDISEKIVEDAPDIDDFSPESSYTPRD